MVEIWNENPKLSNPYRNKRYVAMNVFKNSQKLNTTTYMRYIGEWATYTDNVTDFCRELINNLLSGEHHQFTGKQRIYVAKLEKWGLREPAKLPHTVHRFVKSLTAVSTHYCRDRTSRTNVCKYSTRTWESRSVTRIFKIKLNIGFHLPTRQMQTIRNKKHITYEQRIWKLFFNEGKI